MACKKYDLQELQEIRKSWIDIPVEAVPEDQQELFERRKRAIDMYIDGHSLVDIHTKTDICHSNIVRFIERCMKIKEDGTYFGYQALLRYNRTDTVEKVHNNGHFNKLLSKFPELADYIMGCWYGDKKYTLERNMNYRTLHSRFLKKCLDLGVCEYDYPFNTENKGYVSLRLFVKRMDKRNIEKASTRDNKDNRQKLMSTGFGKRYTTNTLYPFSTVQIDGHIIDIMYNVEIQNEDGSVDKVVATRAWLIAVIDVATRCVLGYSISQEFNYNQYDVIEALRNAILPKEYPQLTVKNLSYPENGGFYQTALPDITYALYDTVMLDNAKSHLAINTLNKMVDQLHCSVNFGSVATPETRGIVERFFGSLERRGFHKMPSTTGSNTKDLKRRNPEKAAIAYDISYDEIVQLVDVLIAEYNNTPHSGIENLTPLECMKRRVEDRGMIPSIADEKMVKTVMELNYLTTTRRVCGGKNGKRAYINYEGAEYRGNELSVSNEYVGKTIRLIINPRDISEIAAYNENGAYIGVLRAKGEFGMKSHSIKTRKNANRLARERGRDKMEFNPAITALEQELNSKARKNRRDATKTDILRREIRKGMPSQMQAAKEEEPTPVVDIKDYKAYENITDPDEFYNVVLKGKRG